MIITLRSQSSIEERASLQNYVLRLLGSDSLCRAIVLHERDYLVTTPHRIHHEIETLLLQQNVVEQISPLTTPYQLVSRTFQSERSTVVVGNDIDATSVALGGESGSPVIIAGPCAVESRAQLFATACAVQKAGAHMLRGGVFKPRTSPYAFQGLGLQGLTLLAEARDMTGLPFVTEVMEPEMVDTVAEYADALQIGSRNMYNYPLLQRVGHHQHKRPVLLKRGLSATIEEWLLAAEYIVAAGNPNVVLCERGIRSYDSQTRNVLDLTCVPLLRTLTHLPILVDPSHGTGQRELVAPLSNASIAVGADGLLLEVHHDPDNALCDGRQSITPSHLQHIIHDVTLLTHLFQEHAK